MKNLMLIGIVLQLVGCGSLQHEMQLWNECESEVGWQFPPQMVQQLVRTDRVCTDTGGDSNHTQTCSSTPIYDTVDINKEARNYAIRTCTNAKR